MNLTETEVAERIRDGTQTSPVAVGNMTLVNLRITGTGLAYRANHQEFVWRNPDFYLNEDFLKRCNGLAVVVDHPEGDVLTDEEFAARSVGSVMLPYLREGEVWAVCRIYSQDIVQQIEAGTVSTSPCISVGGAVLDAAGESLLIEGKPVLLDHIALVTAERGSLGVWDKNGMPEGVENNTEVNNSMSDEKLDKILEALGSLSSTVSELKTRQDSNDERFAALEKNTPDADVPVPVAPTVAEPEPEPVVIAEKTDDAPPAPVEVKDDSAEQEAKADIQARADQAYAQFGQQARAPMSGENALNYRKRLMKDLQSHSATYKDVDIAAMNDPALVAIAERQIYADAVQSANNPVNIQKGTLLPRVRKDEAGRRITEYHGDMNTWLSAFKSPGQQLVKFGSAK